MTTTHGSAARTTAPRPLLLVSLLLAACQPSPAATVLDAGEIGTLQQSPLVSGRDGAYSAVVWGSEVWTFGDTFLAIPNAQGDTLVSNTVATSATQLGDGGLVLTDRLDDAGAPDGLLHPTADEEAYDLAHAAFPDGGCDAGPCGARFATWPASMVFDPADGGTALLFYDLVVAIPGAYSFSSVGQSIAVWSDPASLPTRAELSVCPDFPTLLFCPGEPAYGAAAAVIDGDLYAFACASSYFSFPCQVAKVPLAQALVRSAWLFWDGNEWSSDLYSSQTLFDGASILGVFYDSYVAQWVAIYSVPQSNDVVYRTAPAITGPWSGTGKLFEAQQGDGGGTTYDALPHPELSEADGQVVYVTYSRPTSAPFGSEIALVRVVLQKLP